jgi:hypothetical protein
MLVPTTAAEAARRRRLIRAQERSGLTQEEFCRRQDVSLHAFRVWKYRGEGRGGAGARDAGPCLVPVRLLGGADACIEVSLGGGRSVRVGPGFDEATLRRVIAVLETPSC